MPVEVLSDVARESVDMQTPVKQETLSSDGGNPLHSMHGEDVKCLSRHTSTDDLVHKEGKGNDMHSLPPGKY